MMKAFWKKVAALALKAALYAAEHPDQIIAAAQLAKRDMGAFE